MRTSLILFLVLLVPVSACSAEGAPFKIGAIASLTGAAGEQGQNWVNGAKLAAEELRREGSDVELLIEDDGTVPAKAASAFQKLVSEGAAAIIGGTWDFLGEAIYPLAQRHRIPVLTPTNPIEVLSPVASGNPYVLTNCFSLASAAPVVEQFLRARAVRRLALIYPSLPFGVAQAQMVEQRAGAGGGSVISRVEFPIEGYLDAIKVAALKVSRSRADLVFLVADYAGLDIFEGELTRTGASIPILTTQHLDQAAMRAKDPARFRATFGLYPASILNGGFRKRFEQRFGFPARVFAVEGYDAVRFFAGTRGMNWEAPRPFEMRGEGGMLRLKPGRRDLSEEAPRIVAWREGALAP